MTNENTVEITIKGFTPLLLNRYVPKKEDEIDGNEYGEEWKGKVYLMEKDGEQVVGIPQTMIMACLYDGSKGKRRSKIYFTKELFSSVRPTEMIFPLLVEGKTVTLDRIEKENWINIIGAKLGRGQTIDRRRPEMPIGWTLSFGLQFMGGKLTAKDMKQVVSDSGSRGMGDWRPSSKKPGMYGQFKLTEYSIR